MGRRRWRGHGQLRPSPVVALHDVRITGGLYDSRSQGISNLSSYLAIGTRADAVAGCGAVRPAEPTVGSGVEHDADRQPAVATVAPGVRLMQQISMHDHRPTILFRRQSHHGARRVRRRLSDRPPAVPAVQAVPEHAQSHGAPAARSLFDETWAPTCGPMARSTTRPPAARFSTWARFGGRAAPAARSEALAATWCVGSCATRKGNRSRARPWSSAARVSFTKLARRVLSCGCGGPQRYALTVPARRFPAARPLGKSSPRPPRRSRRRRTARRAVEIILRAGAAGGGADSPAPRRPPRPRCRRTTGGVAHRGHPPSGERGGGAGGIAEAGRAVSTRDGRSSAVAHGSGRLKAPVDGLDPRVTLSAAKGTCPESMPPSLRSG